MTQSHKSPLAPLTFADNRPFGQRTSDTPNKLVFVPVYEDFLKDLERLYDCLGDLNGRVQRPIDTVLTLLQSNQKEDRAMAGRMIDTQLLHEAYELINSLDEARKLIELIEYSRSEAKLATEYIEKEVRNG